MKSKLLALLLMLSMAVSSCANMKTPFEPALNSLVKIQTRYIELDQTAVCAGVLIAPQQALTAAHCVSTDTDNILFVNGEPSSILGYDGVFALVGVPGDSRRPIQIRGSSPSRGETVWTIGYGYNLLLTMKRTVAGFIDGDLILDVGTPHGMSGGPTVDEKGRLVGINQASDGITTSVCGVEEIKEFLNRPISKP